MTYGGPSSTLVRVNRWGYRRRASGLEVAVGLGVLVYWIACEAVRKGVLRVVDAIERRAGAEGRAS